MSSPQPPPPSASAAGVLPPSPPLADADVVSLAQTYATFLQEKLTPHLTALVAERDDIAE
eukprot:CAMPEP_0182484220 /NCGR_PEP_ID=MMETSP1319-20130603/43021_1 /TAXON_ID=172717 /ORGANISM="Bolidomonas pacifica, Strain RCC208" /LENGTH=59 /DNA_ID=CAMNT_0024686105 /DNA_START=119 /DNA_END=295 /DNA_ORIENTATION=+